MYRSTDESTFPIRRQRHTPFEKSPESSPLPLLEYLATSSAAGLEAFELSRLNVLANLRKECEQILDEFVENEVQARIARFLAEKRRNRDLHARDTLHLGAEDVAPIPIAARASKHRLVGAAPVPLRQRRVAPHRLPL